MKSLEKDQLETLLKIIGSSSIPSLQIAHFSENGELLVSMLAEYCSSKNYEYHLKCTNKEFYEQMAQKFEEKEKIVVSNFFLERRSYLVQAREYNFLFVSTIIEEEKRGEFLKRSHKIIRSAGNIIIFVPKKDYAERDSWVAHLEENLYVSTNIMDDLFEHYDVIISRKMHGWGD